MLRSLALDIGGTKIAAALVDENNIITNRKQIASLKVASIQDFYNHLESLINEYSSDTYDYVAVASTGIIKQGILTALNPINLGGIDRFELTHSLHKITQKEYIYALNDAQAAAYAEFGQASTADFCFITVSTGVGGGIVLNQELLQGRNGLAGHIGHTLADPNGPICGCERKGCVEAVASGVAIAKTFLANTPNSNFNANNITAKEVFSFAQEGDKIAQAAILTSAQAIANLVADIYVNFDIKEFSFGGSISLADGYLDLVKEHLQTIKFIPLDMQLKQAFYLADAGLIGAANWGLKQFKFLK